jgi:glycosyltransferase involved in cell wall biosynthesis
MSKKIRVLAWSDLVCHTGFGIVADKLYRGLHDTGNYDLRVVGINYLGQKAHDYPFFVYPTDTQDRMGITRVLDALNDIGVKNIDVLFLFQDIWNMKYILNRQTRPKNELLIEILKKQNPNLKVVLYFPLDSTPFNDHWIGTIGAADVVITYTKWARDHIKSVLRETDFKDKEILSVPHAIDTEPFCKLEQQKIDFYRRKRGWAHKFVVYTVNRFQPRKNFSSMLRAFNLFLSGYKKCECGNYYDAGLTTCDLNGCGKDRVTSIVRGKENVHYYLHCEVTNYAMGSDRAMPEFDLPSALRSAGFTYDQINERTEILEPGSYETGKITLKELNQIYNAGDVFVTTTFGEGWGLTVGEALLTGTTVIAPNNSSLPEVIGTAGHLVNNVGYTFLPMDNNLKRPVVSVEGVVDALEQEYEKWIKNNKKKVVNFKGIKRGKQITWENVIKQFDTIIKEAVHETEKTKDVKDSSK